MGKRLLAAGVAVTLAFAVPVARADTMLTVVNETSGGIWLKPGNAAAIWVEKAGTKFLTSPVPPNQRITISFATTPLSFVCSLTTKQVGNERIRWTVRDGGCTLGKF